MKLILFYFFIVCVSTGYISCKCHLVDCEGAAKLIKVRLTDEGQNALFGSQATLHRDSIRFFNLDELGYDEFISYNDSTETMDLFIEDGVEYILKVENIRTDTMNGSFVVTEMGECECETYQLSELKINGQRICMDGCNEIIELQL
jgi:hypothetical protein